MQFWRCKYVFVYYSNVQRTFKDGKITVNRIYEATCDETSQVYKSYVKELGLIILDACQL